MLLAADRFAAPASLTREIHELESPVAARKRLWRRLALQMRSDLTAKAADFSRALLAVITNDVRTWDAFRWAVIVLFALNVLFLLSLTGSIRSEIAALSQEQSAGIDQLARVTKEIADTRASLTQAISDTRSGLQGHIAKLNTKVDARLQQAPTASQPPAASPKPSAKPRPPSSRSRAWPW